MYRSIRPKLIAAEMLSQAGILKRINKRKREDASLIKYNLGVYGYSLISPSESKKAKKLPIEELITQILVYHPDARYLESIPIIIIKNKIDKFKMLELASKYSIKNKIGYLIETAMIIKKLAYLEDLLCYLESMKDESISFLVEGDYDFLSETSPERVRKWHLLGRFFDNDFKRNAEAYL